MISIPIHSPKRMMWSTSMTFFGRSTRRCYDDSHKYYTSIPMRCYGTAQLTKSFVLSSSSHALLLLSTTTTTTTTSSYRVLSTWTPYNSSSSSSSSSSLLLSEPQLALAYDYIDTDDEKERHPDTTTEPPLQQRLRQQQQHPWNHERDTPILHTTTTNNNTTTTKTNTPLYDTAMQSSRMTIGTHSIPTTTTTNEDRRRTYHRGDGGSGGGGGSRHRCPKCGTFVTFQHADFDVANHSRSSSSSNSTTFYCAHCSGWFLLQQQPYAPPNPSPLLSTATSGASGSIGNRTVTVDMERTNLPPTFTTTAATTTTTTSGTNNDASSPPPPPQQQQQQQRIILRVNHHGGGGGSGSLPPPLDATPPTSPPEPDTIPTPYEIVQGLNEYVIGQRNVKIALSVGIYNHYKRLFINSQSGSSSSNMMNHQNATTSPPPEEPLRSSPSQRPSTSSSFIIVRHPNNSSGDNSSTDLNNDMTTRTSSHGNNSLPYPSPSTTNSENSFADYTTHLTQFGTTSTTTTTTENGDPTTTTSRSSTSTSKDDSSNNNIKYNGRDHSMDGTDDNIEIDKSNILLLGPTGSGKTLLVRTLAKLIQVPLVITDATCLTQAGYVGEDVESILFKLYIESNYDIHKTQRGIIYIDEVDKIRKSGGPNISISRDVSGEGVQHALLKIVEGNVINVPKEPGRKNPRGDFLQIDTTNILFIAGGAFSGLEHIINRRMDAASIGFNANMKKMNMDTNIKVQGRYFDQAIPKDLVEYGMIPEFVGRFPVITTTKGLDLDNLVDILTKPKNSIMKQYTKLFHMDDVQFHITDEALLEIAKTAYTRGTGARGLRSITDAVLMDTQYIVPSFHHNNKNIHTVYVDGAAVRKERPIILLHDPNLTVEMYESFLEEGRAYSSIPGVMPVSIDEFEFKLQQQQGEVESSTVTTTDPSPLEEVAA